MDPKLRNLEIFRIFALTQNVTETARQVRVSQPAVSQILHDLEQTLGLTLFKRVGRTLQLTAEAQALLPDINRLIGQMGALRNKVEDLRSARAGSLSFASVPTMISEVVPEAVLKFTATRPNVRLRIASLTAADVGHYVRVENADLGLTFLPINANGLNLQPVVKTSMACLMPRKHKLASREVITPGLLDGEVVIAQGPATPPGFVLRDTFAQAGISDLVALEVNQSGVALPMVRKGMGVALAHPFVLPLDQDEVIAVPFEPDVELVLSLVFAKSAAQSQLASAFVAELMIQIRAHANALAAKGLKCLIN